MNKFPDSAIDSVIDAVTIKAYLETEYRIYSATPFTLKVGMACPILAELQDYVELLQIGRAHV